jgi:valyl-tRNA synthetase
LSSVASEETGPVSGKPPVLSNAAKDAVKDGSGSSPIGSHIPGQDTGSKVGTAEADVGEKKVKSEKECMDTL